MPQFTIRTLLLAVTAAAVWLGALAGLQIVFEAVTGAPKIPLSVVFRNSAIYSPCWSAAVFAGYAIGRRSLTVTMIACFGIAEALLIVTSVATIKQLFFH